MISRASWTHLLKWGKWVGKSNWEDNSISVFLLCCWVDNFQSQILNGWVSPSVRGTGQDPPTTQKFGFSPMFFIIFIIFVCIWRLVKFVSAQGDRKSWQVFLEENQHSKGPFLVLHFSCYTLMTFLMMLFVTSGYL